MPHFGLMNETVLGPVAGPRQRARLHLRGARRRLRQGRVAAGIVTLYDTVTAAMESYAAERIDGLSAFFLPGEDPKKEKVQYKALVRAGVLDGTFDFEAFDALAERALAAEMPGYDYREVLAGVEGLLLQLHVLPFDESLLPPEDPSAP